MTVSKLAEKVGTSADTVRYYERIGLLPEPDRSAAGYRLYEPDATERLRFIKNAQRFGLRLEAIGQLLQVREQGLCPCGHTRALLEGRLSELDEELGALERLRSDIAQMLEQPTASPDASPCQSLVQLSANPNNKGERSMSATDTACGCGCSQMTDVTNAEEPCTCGCACCTATAKTSEQEVAELENLRDSIDRRLGELEGR